MKKGAPSKFRHNLPQNENSDWFLLCEASANHPHVFKIVCMYTVMYRNIQLKMTAWLPPRLTSMAKCISTSMDTKYLYSWGGGAHLALAGGSPPNMHGYISINLHCLLEAVPWSQSICTCLLYIIKAFVVQLLCYMKYWALLVPHKWVQTQNCTILTPFYSSNRCKVFHLATCNSHGCLSVLACFTAILFCIIVLVVVQRRCKEDSRSRVQWVPTKSRRVMPWVL